MKQGRYLSQYAYFQELALRKRHSRITALVVMFSGSVSVTGVAAYLLLGDWELLSGFWLTDIFMIAFMLASGLYLIIKGHFLYTQFMCRFCLAQIPEKALECPCCNEDLTCMDIDIHSHSDTFN